MSCPSDSSSRIHMIFHEASSAHNRRPNCTTNRLQWPTQSINLSGVIEIQIFSNRVFRILQEFPSSSVQWRTSKKRGSDVIRITQQTRLVSLEGSQFSNKGPHLYPGGISTELEETRQPYVTITIVGSLSLSTSLRSCIFVRDMPDNGIGTPLASERSLHGNWTDLLCHGCRVTRCRIHAESRASSSFSSLVRHCNCNCLSLPTNKLDVSWYLAKNQSTLCTSKFTSMCDESDVARMVSWLLEGCRVTNIFWTL